jgi:hypothetical protein
MIDMGDERDATQRKGRGGGHECLSVRSTGTGPMGVQEGQALSSRSASASYIHHDEWSWPGSAPHSGHGSASRASRIASRFSLVRLRALASSKRRCRPFFNGQLPITPVI